MYRTLHPEVLDTLGPAEPEAQRSRRDLEVINRVMRNNAWFAAVAPRVIAPSTQVLELGAGTGRLCRMLHRTHPHCDGLDLWPGPADWPEGKRWHQADVLQFDSWAPYSAVIGNLIFHQFSDDDLNVIGTSIRAHSRVILACEPARYRIFQWLFRALCPLIGANRVTRHDGHVSIAAGFRGYELPRSLGLEAPEWQVETQTTLLGGYHMIARKI